MAELVFLVVTLAVVFALAMRRAPLWLWALATAAVTFVWTSGILDGSEWMEEGLLSGLAWLPAALLGILSIPSVRRRLIVAPTFAAIKQVLPKVSDTEAQALDAGTIGFDAELFSGRPDWAKLRAVPGIVLTSEEKAFLDGPTDDLCRMIDDLGLREETWLSRHADL